MAKQSRFLYHDHHDIIFEILSWLPVKSLMRFVCVCKSWRALISSSQFVSKHLSRAVTGINRSRLKLFLDLPSSICLQSIDYKDLLKVGDGRVASEGVSFPFPGCCDHPRRLDPTIVGSCNGLICLVRACGCFFLWNPSTRVTNKLPEHPIFHTNNNKAFYPTFYGFGYDSTTDDYKVIAGITDSLPSTLPTCNIAVFTLKTGSWRNLEDQKAVKMRAKGCLYNEALHWGVFDIDASYKMMLFHLAEEKFREAPLPNLLGSPIRRGEAFEIATIGNSLCVRVSARHSNMSDSRIAIWMMKEYGVEQSWTKLLQIPTRISGSARRFFWPMPISVLENGEVLLSCAAQMVLYNPPKDTVRVFYETSDNIYSSAINIETLVSPVT